MSKFIKSIKGIVVHILIGSSLLIQTGCQKAPKLRDANQFRQSKVVIITYKSHEVLDAIVKSTIDALINDFQINQSCISVYNPNGKLDEIQTYVRGLNSKTTNLIISVSTPTTQAVLSSRHPNIPVLYSFVSNPAILKSTSINNNTFANVTGISNVLNYKAGFELLKKIMPNVNTIAVLYNPSEANSSFSFNQIKTQADIQVPPIKIIARQFSKPNEIQTMFSSLPSVDAVYVGGDNTLVSNISLLLSVTANRKIPVFASDEGSVQKGAIAAYSIDYSAFGKKTAELAVDILKKGNASSIAPIDYTEGRCVLNKSAIAKLKISIPKDFECEVIK